jgi:hypothetical protein
MEPTADEIEATKRTSQQVLEQSTALLERFGRSNVDFAKLLADLQAEVRMIGEAIKSPKTTEEMARQYLTALEELRSDMQKVDAILGEAPASAPASGGSAAKPSRRRGMRV